MADIIGVLALQGAFKKHQEILAAIGAKSIQVRMVRDLEECAGLIIPGGESSAIWRQMNFSSLCQAIVEFAKEKPLFGTCAGLILMSSAIAPPTPFEPFHLLDIAVERNAFGRQADSFAVDLDLNLPKGACKRIRSLFIRAPQIMSVGKAVSVLATLNGKAVAVQQGRHLGATFHPELAGEGALHRHFLDLVNSL